jgi:hypothetical protein
MNHNKIIEIILKNQGVLVGSYIREWLGNGKPMDNGWNDIDIKCPIENIEKIQKEIKQIDQLINLDFKATYFDSSNSGYSSNYFTYDGNFKLCNNIYPKYNFASDLWLDLTKKKICIFLNTSPIGRKLNLEDKFKNNNWKLFYRYSIKDPYLIE